MTTTHSSRTAALKAVRQWRYTPALMNGEPWPVEMGITLVYQFKQ